MLAGSPSTFTAGFNPRTRPIGLPSEASTRIRPSAFGRFARLSPHRGQPLRAVAVGGALFGDRLIEAERRGAAAVSEQDHLADATLAAEVLDAGLDVLRNHFPDDGRFVVVEPRVHREHEEPAAGQLPGREVPEVVVHPMDQQHRDVALA